MKGVRFYEEFLTTQRRITLGTVVAAIVCNGHNGSGDYDAIAGVTDRPNSMPTSTTVSTEYLRTRCKRIPESRAREIHPTLFLML